MKHARKHAKNMAFKGGCPEDEPFLNPYKNDYRKVWNSSNLADVWRDAFLEECQEIMIRCAEDDADEAYHS